MTEAHTTPPIKHAYGWRPDVPDRRDIPYRAPAAVELPPKVDLREHVLTVYNQGALGSCTANALGAAFQMQRNKQGAEAWDPSRLFIYYNEREMEGTINEDAGAYLRDGIKSLVRHGVCDENIWPYDVNEFNTRPFTFCYQRALEAQVLGYRRVSSNLRDMKSVLAQGLPFVVGIGIYESFESPEVAKSGVVPMPGWQERLLGGHAITCVGYDDESERFIMLNSWGKEWGDNGYFYLPYKYLSDDSLADDRWVISKTE